MAVYSYYGDKKDDALRRDAVGMINPNQLPVISQGLDSVRTYQWEFQLDLPGGGSSDVVAIGGAETQRTITLAAKVVAGVGYNFADIEVHRMNDKVFYPGKISQDELTITFDNLLQQSMGVVFYNYLASIYDMRTGYYNNTAGGVGSYKTSARILEFDGGGNITTVYDFKGLYPKSFSKAEKNYSTSEFDTMEVKFRWDFMHVLTGGEAVNTLGLLN
jgi:hypothetical protein